MCSESGRVVSLQNPGMNSWAGPTASLAAGEALIETRRLDDNRDFRKLFLLSALAFLLYNSIAAVAAAAAAAVVAVADISQTGAFSLCQAPDRPSRSQKVLLPHLCTV